MAEMKFISLNVRGLREGKKQRDIFHWFKRYYQGNQCFVLLQETHSNPTDENIWKNEWCNDIIFSHRENNSKGVAILCPKQSQNTEILKTAGDKEGRMCLINLKHNSSEMCLINVYAPVKNEKKSQLNFLDTLSSTLAEYETTSFVIGGDFNTYFDPVLDKYGGTFEIKSTFSTKLQQCLQSFEICDIWRLQNPNVKRYTWRQNKPLIQSRLDYFLISENLSQNVCKCDIKPSIKTDHSMILLNLTQLKGHKRGPGFWKFNTSLLKDEIYIDYIKEIISQLKNNLKHMENKGLKWDYIKSEIRQRTITYSKTQARLKREHENDMLDMYNELNEKFDKTKDTKLLEEIETVKSEIEKINNKKTEGNIIRSKAKNIIDQQNASFYVNKEKKNYKTSHITMLESTNGNTISEPAEVLSEIKHFYENLYNNQHSTENFDHEFLSNVKKLEQKNINDLEKELQIDECEKALRKMKNGKTPGSDGLSVEFYKIFWQHIKDLVYESFIHGYNIGELSIDQKRGIIKLLPKKGKILKFLKNWRPISLLNTDYKILAHVLAMRLQLALPSIIHPDQNGYLENRFIGCNIRTIYDIIELSQTEPLSNIITLVDYEKAFVNIKWNFLQKALTAFGFGKNFRNWINVMYSGSKSIE